MTVHPSPFRGPLQGVVFDWAGTIVDYGSFAPTKVLIQAFAERDVAVSLVEARVPMGLPKWDHIQALGRLPGVAGRWRERHGRTMTRDDVDALYARFMPLQLEYIAAYSAVIPGVLETLRALRARGLRLGSTTGYPRQVMDVLVPFAEDQGLRLDHNVAGDDLKPGGRPGPWMALANVIELGIRDVGACVKVDDTEPGILEGRGAGMWTVGVAVSGNEMGLALEEVRALAARERQERRDRAAEKFLGWGAHYVVDTVADLPHVLGQIEERLRQGERP
jgi:phosphonoacetaldehyde hydrolase